MVFRKIQESPGRRGKRQETWLGKIIPDCTDGKRKESIIFLSFSSLIREQYMLHGHFMTPCRTLRTKDGNKKISTVKRCRQNVSFQVRNSPVEFFFFVSVRIESEDQGQIKTVTYLYSLILRDVKYSLEKEALITHNKSTSRCPA